MHCITLLSMNIDNNKENKGRYVNKTIYICLCALFFFRNYYRYIIKLHSVPRH